MHLDGLWQFKLGNGPWREIQVPGAWEPQTGDFLTEGPAVYRRTLTLDAAQAAGQVALVADAVSFDCTVRVNGARAGHHRGMWAPFTLDLSGHWHAGENTLELEVWKPGQRFPIRESVAGFLPDVCTTFGGIWQSIHLRFGPAPRLYALTWHTDHRGTLTISGRCAAPETGDQVWLALDGERLAAGPARRHFRLRAPHSAASAWTSETPRCYTATVSLARADGTVVAVETRTIGFRRVQARGSHLLINGQPGHLRGVLDWGWSPDSVRPVRPEIARDFSQARSLGFNLFKCCLYVPDEALLNAADQTGMWVWLEMPLWLPTLPRSTRALALDEYRAVFQRLHHHACIGVVSLGCELNHAADGAFLKQLFTLARRYFPHAVLCDNSGSAEAYGGQHTELHDFYDYHFYTDPHWFAEVTRHFHRPYQPARPWLYGEFCDADTLRDFAQVADAWWLTTPTPLERDEYTWQREHGPRLAASGIDDHGRALTTLARKQATAVRKFILEEVRAGHASGGYVITGWRDTPIATSGLVDDHGELKYAPEAWRAFNQARVFGLDRERHRRWVGGDRPAPRDRHVYWSDEGATLHVWLSNGAPQPTASSALHLTLQDAQGQPVWTGRQSSPPVPGGTVREVAVFSLRLPRVTTATAYTLSVHADELLNSWPIVVAPRMAAPRDLRLSTSLAEAGWVASLWPDLAVDHGFAPLVLGNRLDDHAVARAAAGAHVVVCLTDTDQRITVDLPFWREAIHVFADSAWWAPTPQPGFADMRFLGVSTDLALDPGRIQALLAPQHVRPLWRRFDARTMTWAEYATTLTLGQGRLTLTTLRLAGGLGTQPVTLSTNPMGTWLLHRLLASPAFA
jgi:hypothetical protein